MPVGPLGYAVFGASPFALLLAGLLRVHGKSVCLVGDPWSAYRLPRGFDVSVMPATRPETWALLKRGAAETTRLLRSVGKNLYERVDPLYVAETEASADYLGHMRWVASGLSFEAERTADRAIAAEGAIYVIRDAAMLTGGRIEPVLEDWLDRLEVKRLPARATTLSFPRQAPAAITFGEMALEAETVVLADDEAILMRLGGTERHALLSAAPRVSLVTEPARPLSAPLIHYFDRDVILHQETQGAISAIASGEADAALPRIAASLSAAGRLRRAGQTLIHTVGTTDGAPLIGRMGRGKATVIAGLGPSAAFLAPIVARVLANSASDDEARYFELRSTSKPAGRRLVVEAAS
jgi:hypothetical protein